MDKIAEEYPDLTAADLDLVSYKMQKFVVRRWLLDEGKRVDGRGINEIRPLAAEVGILPRVHGSGMFTRGQMAHWQSVLWCLCCPLWKSSPTPSAACLRCSPPTVPPLRHPSAALRWP
ncbi:Polyribonucleotide nucleotidyltransferase [uncultured Clostridium sp.]|nr:Polyribonucleotide nucleotidyltransferase [uncultured Clostridium sp.]